MKAVCLALLIIGFNSLLAQDFFIGYDTSASSAVSKKDMTIASDVWLTQIASDVDLHPITKMYDDPAEMAQDVADGKLDYIAASGFTFVKYFDLSLLQDGFTQGFLNGKEEKFVFVVRKESDIKSVADISTQKIAMQEDDSVIKLYLKDKIKKSDRVNIELFKSRQRALLKLFFGKAEVAVSTNRSFALAAELNPQIGKKLKILEVTQLQATPFGFLRKGADESMKRTLLHSVKKVHETPKGKQLLTLYKAEIIVDSKLEDLGQFQKLYNNNNKE